MAQILDEDLAEGFSLQGGGRFVDARSFVLAAGDIEFDGAPRGARQASNLLKEFGRSTPKGDESNPHLLQTGKVGIGRKLRVKDEMARVLAVGAFPESDEAEDLLGLFAFADVGVGVAEG